LSGGRHYTQTTIGSPSLCGRPKGSFPLHTRVLQAHSAPTARHNIVMAYTYSYELRTRQCDLPDRQSSRCRPRAPPPPHAPSAPHSIHTTYYYELDNELPDQSSRCRPRSITPPPAYTFFPRSTRYVHYYTPPPTILLPLYQHSRPPVAQGPGSDTFRLVLAPASVYIYICIYIHICICICVYIHTYMYIPS